MILRDPAGLSFLAAVFAAVLAAAILGGAASAQDAPEPGVGREEPLEATDDGSGDDRAGGRDPVEALRRGNQLFRGGQLDQAEAAYLEGWDPARPHPLLAYNLGSTLHHLDRLPEAILWYRRAEDSEDPWLEENLRLARRTLGTPRAPRPGFAATVVQHRRTVAITAIALAWTVPLALLLLPLGGLRLAAAGLGAAAALLFGAAVVGADRWAPREVVLLEDCSGPGGELPAGTEAWAEPMPDGAWGIVRMALVCPADAAAPIRDASR